jgi:hypothetical protein
MTTFITHTMILLVFMHTMMLLVFLQTFLFKMFSVSLWEWNSICVWQSYFFFFFKNVIVLFVRSFLVLPCISKNLMTLNFGILFRGLTYEYVTICLMCWILVFLTHFAFTSLFTLYRWWSMIWDGATPQVAAVIQDGAVQEALFVVLICQEAQVTVIVIVVRAGG